MLDPLAPGAVIAEKVPDIVLDSYHCQLNVVGKLAVVVFIPIAPPPEGLVVNEKEYDDDEEEYSVPPEE